MNIYICVIIFAFITIFVFAFQIISIFKFYVICIYLFRNYKQVALGLSIPDFPQSFVLYIEILKVSGHETFF